MCNGVGNEKARSLLSVVDVYLLFVFVGCLHHKYLTKVGAWPGCLEDSSEPLEWDLENSVWQWELDLGVLRATQSAPTITTLQHNSNARNLKREMRVLTWNWRVAALRHCPAGTSPTWMT